MKSIARGFTLVELLVVVVLIAIMLAIAVPSFASFIANYRVTTAMNDFLQGVTTTRLEALKRGKFVDMVPKVAGNWQSGWRIIVDSDKDHALSPGDEVIFEHDALSSFITVSNPSSGGFDDGTASIYIAFDGTGYPRKHSTVAGVTGPLTGGVVMVDGGAPRATVKHALCLAAYGRPRTFTLASGIPDCSGG